MARSTRPLLYACSVVLFEAALVLAVGGPYKLAFRLTRSDFDAPERFGRSLAASGSTLVVSGSPGEEPGSILLFDGGTGGLLRRVTAPVPSSGDGFGLAVGASDNLIAVAAAGVVHLFGPDGEFLRSLEPTPGNVFYRPQVAVSGDQVLVGDDSGDGLPRGVFLFDGGSGATVNVFHPEPGDCPTDFGTRVALAGGMAFIKADCSDSVQAFRADTGQLVWARSAIQTGDEFGHALVADGDRLFVGSPGSHRLEFGAVYLLDAGTGAIVRKYRGKTRGSGFGTAVAVRARQLLIGAPGSRRGNGIAYLLDSSTGSQLARFRKGRDEGRLGFAVALLDGRIAVSAPYTVSSPPVTLVFRK